MGIGGFAGGFADGLNTALNRNAMSKYNKRNQNQPDYTDIDDVLGPNAGGIGATVRGAKRSVSEWLHRNTGGILGHSYEPVDPAGEVQNDVWNEQPTMQAVPLEQSGARGGMVRNYRDGGGVVRSFRDGGSGAGAVRANQRRFQAENTPGQPGEVDPGLSDDELDARDREESMRAAGYSTPVGGARAAAQSLVPPTPSGPAAPRLPSTEDDTARIAAENAPNFRARDPSAVPTEPVASTGPATTSALGRWWASLDQPGYASEQQARFKEMQALQERRAELSNPLRQQTAEQQKAEEAELAAIDEKVYRLSHGQSATNAEAKPKETPKETPKPSAVPVPPTATTTPPAPPAAPAAPITPPAPVTPSPAGMPSTVFGAPGTPVAPMPAPAGPPPTQTASTAPTVTTPANTGGGTGAAPQAPPPPGATPPQTRTAAYDPDKEGPGSIPTGTVVTGSSGTPSAVALGAPDASGNQARQMAPYDPDAMLSEAISGGVRHLRETFDQNRQTAVPGAPDPQKAAGLQALHAGHGAPGPDVVHRIDQGLRAHGLNISRNDKWQTARLIRGYQFYKMNGDTKKADAFAAELLQHHNMMLQHYGQGALDALKKGDSITAEQHILDGYNLHIPDGMTARKGAGNSVEFVNPKGAVVKRMSYTPQNLWTAATGMKNGTLFHQELLSRYQNSAQHKAELAQERADAREQRAIEAGERAEKREQRAEERDRRRGAGGAAPAGPLPSQIFAEGGMVKDVADPLPPDQAVSLTPLRLAVNVNDPTGGSANAATGNTSGTVGGTASEGGTVGGSGGVGSASASGTDSGTGGAAAGTSGGSDAGDGGTYRRGGLVHAFQGGGLEQGRGFFTNTEGLIPGGTPPTEAVSPALPPEAVPLTPSSQVPFSQPLMPDAAPANAPPSGYRPPETAPPQEPEPTRYASTEDPDPWHPPKDIYHNGNRVVEPPVLDYSAANPDDRPPHDPRIASDNPADNAFNPGWRERYDTLGVQAKNNKQLGAAYAAATKHFNERMKEFTDAQKLYNSNKKEYERIAKEERAKATEAQKAEAKDAHGGTISTRDQEQAAADTDEAIKKFVPDESEKGTTVFDQTTEVKSGGTTKTKLVVDPKDTRDLVTDLRLKNRMPTDRAIDTFAQLTAFDPDRPNWRSWENRGYDRAGNVILIPKTPRRDDDGNIIFKKPKMGADGKPLPNQIPEPEKWDLDTAHPIHIDPTKHELLNKAITQRIRAGKSKAKQPEPTSIIGNLKKGAGALYTPKYKLDD